MTETLLAIQYLHNRDTTEMTQFLSENGRIIVRQTQQNFPQVRPDRGSTRQFDKHERAWTSNRDRVCI